MTNKHYYQATEVLRRFLDQLDGSYEQFARQVGCSARTIARMRKSGRVNRQTVNSAMKALSAHGFKGSRDDAFELIQGGDQDA